MLRILCATALALFFIHTASAQEYKLGPGDVLQINFWEAPDFNTEVRVSQSGHIALDIVGQIEAAGKTTEQLQVEIVKQMSRLAKNISQSVVRVTEYNYQYVFVTGQVNNGGKLTFERIPDLWTIINEAGGITEFGDLSRVTIIRGGERAGQVEIVNVAEAISTGSLSKLPKIDREDTIEIPRTPVGLPSAELGASIEKKNLIYVVGAVRTPGPLSFEENTDMLEAVAMAGGFDDVADLSKAKVISKDGLYAQTMMVDLEKYAKTGSPVRYIMKKEDVLIVPNRRSGFGGFNLTTMATFVGVISSAVLIYSALQPADNTNTR